MGSSPSTPSGENRNVSVMNKYGSLAMSHWEQHQPDRYQAIPDKQAFFTQLGEQAEQEIQQLEDTLAGPDRPGESYLEKVGRLNMARLAAEEQILSELILLPSSQDPDEEPSPEEKGLAQDVIDAIHQADSEDPPLD
jgi:hypothetical protein